MKLNESLRSDGVSNLAEVENNVGTYRFGLHVVGFFAVCPGTPPRRIEERPRTNPTGLERFLKAGTALHGDLRRVVAGQQTVKES